MRDFVRDLTEIGLTTNEAKVYVSLLKGSKCTVRDLFTVSDVPRQKVYVALSGLLKDVGSYIVQWDSRTDSIGQNEFYGPYRIGRDTVVLVFDIEVTLDSSYTISFIDSTDPVQADLAMAVFSNATNLQRRGEWVAMVDSIGPVREQELTFTATSSGVWSIAVWNKYLPGKAPPGRALIYLHREVGPLSVELVNFWADADIGEVSLKWRVAGETDNLRWILTRAESEDGEFLRIAELRGRGTTPQETTYIYIDKDVVSGNTYYYKLADIDREGDTTWHGPLSAVPGGPRITKIEKNYPNPFREKTFINYQLSGVGTGLVPVQLKIYDISGRLVRTLVDGPQKIGHYREIWDGRDNRGSRVASGIYFLRFDTEDQRKTFKLVKISR